ncbi:endoglucanase 4 [Aplysia californica]|uniref:Endoglucanase n=1 Tax=Aplysia californica TaxID=6500 RepID=A0ABM0K969_APLCA|nr:endoglucanase 4 [Aplysia californica]
MGLRQAILCVLVGVFCLSDADVNVPITNHWTGGFQGNACFDITNDVTDWKVTLTFSEQISSLEVWVADVSEQLEGGLVYVLTSKSWNKHEHAGDELCIDFIGHGNGDIEPTVTASMTGLPNGGSHGLATQAPVTAAPGQTLPSTTQRTLAPPTGNGTQGMLTVNQDWDNRFDGQMEFPVDEDIMGWMINLTFTKPVSKMDVMIGDPIWHSADGYNWLVVDKGQNAVYHKGSQLVLKFFANYEGGKPAPDAQGILVNLGHDNWTVAEAPTTDKSKYNYNDVLFKSILFYEAQRSGKLPDTNRIPYRGDSALGDKGDNGEDLTGGWYDAGDHVKFNFPMAYTTTVLTWGYLLYPDAYKAAGQEDEILDCVRWPLEYLLKCHTAPEELYVQVGDAGADHSYWGPPELMTMARPAYKITAAKPGSDVAMETAAAMSAGYLAFKDKDPTFAADLLTHAEQLWDFAMKYPGKYSDSVQAAAGFYRSFNLTDELCWGSLWLYQATNDSKYLDEAEKLFDPAPAWGMSWDEKTIGNQVLLYKLTGKDKYKTAIEGSFKSWFPGGAIPYSPKGLAYRNQWGSLRYASNMAMSALVAADMGIQPTEYRHWAMCQIHYALGDTGFSFLIGFGDKYPHSPHHRSSSCPNLPAPCGPFVMSSKEPNVHTLYGALVGGPDQSDGYTDDRSNYVNNEVATDYNAGFTTAVAGLKSLWLRSEHPEQTGTATCPYASGSGGTGGGMVIGR